MKCRVLGSINACSTVIICVRAQVAMRALLRAESLSCPNERVDDDAAQLSRQCVAKVVLACEEL